MTSPDGFESLVRETLADVGGSLSVAADTSERLIASAHMASAHIASGSVPRRRRRAWLPPLLAAAAVVALAVGVSVSATQAGKHPTQPGTVAPTATPSGSATTQTSSPTRSPSRSTATSAARTSPPPVTGGKRWDSRTLVITGHSLGGVVIGMSTKTAASAAGVPAFTAVGDGALWPSTQTGATSLLLYLGNFAGQPASTTGGSFSCMGASLSGSTHPTQTVATEAGVKLGDPAARIPQKYGAAAVYIPVPTTGGINPAAGYVVHEGNYDLVFKLNASGTTITGIAGGLAPMTPSECNG